MRRLALILACLGLAGCAAGEPARTGAAAASRACDDGGSGGVIIDGVCL